MSDKAEKKGAEMKPSEKLTNYCVKKQNRTGCTYLGMLSNETKCGSCQDKWIDRNCELKRKGMK